MKISEITTQKNNINTTKIQKKKVIESTGILVGSTAIVPASFLIGDIFSKNKKRYLESIKKEKDIFEKTVQKNTNIGIGLLKKMNKPINDEVIKIVHDSVEIQERFKLEEKLELLKKIRKTHIKEGVKVAAGIGISIGTVILLIKNIYENRKKAPVQINNDAQVFNKFMTNINPSFSKKKRQISFGGIVDKIANQLSPEELKTYQDFVNGLQPTPIEIETARKIAKFRLKDWPQGIINIADLNQTPATDREYHRILLSQIIHVPKQPPMYYRNKDKWFNTQKWKDFQTWPEYIKSAALFERMESIIKRERIKSYAEEKALLENASKKELSLACLKYEIYEEFLSAFNSDNKKVKIPDAIMIKSKNKDECTETLKWIVAKSNSNYCYIDDKNEANITILDQLLTVLEEAEENYKKNGLRTLIWVENFDKLLSNTPENEEVIGDLKDMLDKISKQYKSTIIFGCNDTKKLDPIALQPHRVKIYNIDKEAPLEEIQKIQNNFILSNIQKIPNSDGYRYKYIPFEQDFVDLYLGDFSYRPDILWINSQNTFAIKSVIKNFDVIKKIPYFQKIRSIEFPEPDNMKELDINKLRCTSKVTSNGKTIYEYNLSEKNS